VLDHATSEIAFVAIRALTDFMLHMQQKVVMGQARWNVRSCRLASRSTSTRRRHACCPR
jgi:hypothetical protein